MVSAFRVVSRSLCALAVGLCLVSAAQAADIVPHRAIYDMKLGIAKRNSNIADVRGTMVIENGESCDSWETNQRIKLSFLRNDSGESETESNFASFEAKDGLSYQFSVRNLEDGELDEELRGYATFDPAVGRGKAVFTLPEKTEFDLPAGTLFPTAHMIHLIERAKSGELFLPYLVFDGSRLEGAFDVSTLVLGKEPREKLGFDHALLRGQPMWSMKMAFFPTTQINNDSSPDYEVSVEMLANGVTRSMIMDYGDFSVIATLAKIEPLPKPQCK